MNAGDNAAAPPSSSLFVLSKLLELKAQLQLMRALSRAAVNTRHRCGSRLSMFDQGIMLERAGFNNHL